MNKISRKGFLKVAAAAAMSGVTAGALAACNAASGSTSTSGEALYTPGTYTGTATGIGEVKVTMTFSETAITEVVVDTSNETESIGGVAAPTLQEALMAAQSAEVDNISGATVTTNAVKEAAADCIAQAMGVKTDAPAADTNGADDGDWLGEEPQVEASETRDFDVVVVGAGLSVYFRNQPVGCTATIITQMYDENGVEIRPQTAGLLLAAILSDTLAFRSPTCTAVDVAAAKRLAQIAGVDIDEFSLEMFEAGENLAGKTAEEVFLQDFKVFMCGDRRFGVAQGSYMTRKNLHAAEKLIQPYLEEARNKQNVEDIYMLLTDVPKEESVVICAGRNAAEMLRSGFDTEPDAHNSWTLPGVVSRKKQFIPAMMTAYQEL